MHLGAYFKLALTSILAAALISSCGGGGGSSGGGEGTVGDTDGAEATLFAQAVEYTTFGLYGKKTVIGDLDGDGLNDVAITDYNNDHILIYFQADGGIFGSVLHISASVQNESKFEDVEIADLNNDGKKDLIVSGAKLNSNNLPEPVVFVFFQDIVTGTLGPLREPEILPVGIVPAGFTSKLTIADLNSDGLPDIAQADLSGIHVLYQLAGGGFSQCQSYVIWFVPTYADLHSADMNGDGRQDLVIKSDNLKFRVIFQKPDGSLDPTVTEYQVIPQDNIHAYFTNFELGDINGDGRSDIVILFSGIPGEIIAYYSKRIRHA